MIIKLTLSKVTEQLPVLHIGVDEIEWFLCTSGCKIKIKFSIIYYITKVYQKKKKSGTICKRIKKDVFFFLVSILFSKRTNMTKFFFYVTHARMRSISKDKEKNEYTIRRRHPFVL